MRSLEAFRHVFDTGSVTRAAERLGVSQPAISQTLASLEKAIGTKLFDRSGARRLAPTPEARLMYPACCAALEALERFELAARDVSGGGRVTIGVTPAIALGFAHDAIERLRATFPLIHVHLDPRYAPLLEAPLAAGEMDLAISGAPAVTDKVESEFLISLPAVVVVPSTHRLAGRGGVAPADLDGEAMAVVHRQSSYRPSINATFAAAGCPLAPAVEAPGFTLCDFVERGQGIGVMSAISAWRYRERALAIIPLVPHVPCDLYALRRRGTALHPFCAAFRDEITRLCGVVAAVVPPPRGRKRSAVGKRVAAARS